MLRASPRGKYRLGRRAHEGPRLHRRGAQGRHPGRHDGLEDGRLPARRRRGPLQDGLGRGLRQAVDRLGRLLHRRLRRGDDDEPGRHRLGIGRRRASARSGRRCTASTARRSSPRRRHPRRRRPEDAAQLPRRRLHPAAAVPGEAREDRERTHRAVRPCGPPASTGCSWGRRSAWSSSAPCSSGRPPRPARTSPAATPRRTCASSSSTSAIGLVLMVMVLATDHRWVRIVAPLVYVGSIVGLVAACSWRASTINGSRSWLQLGGMSIQPSEFAKLAVVIGMALLVAERSRGPVAPRRQTPRGARACCSSPASRPR